MGSGWILILDEFIVVLFLLEIDRLFGVVRGLCAAGVGIVYILHRVGELASIVDRVIVLCDGWLVATTRFVDIICEELLWMMVGCELTELYFCVRS